MAKKPSLQMVADKVGCSLAVVSAVLNNRGKNAIRVSEKRRQEVVAAARTLGFKVSHTTHRLGVYMRPNKSDVPVGYYEVLSSMILQEALKAGLAVEIITDKTLDPRLDASLDGIIGAGHDEPLAKMGNIPNFPVISVNHPMADKGIHSVWCDHEGQGYLATAHGIEKGHRRIAFLEASAGTWGCNERLRGYKRALEEAKIPFNPSLIGHFDRENGETTVDQWVKDDVTLILNLTSVRCLDVVDYLTNTLALKLGDDMSLISINDLPVLRFFHPPQTVINQPLSVLAKEAVALMDRLIKAREATSDEVTVEDICIPARLIERSSVKDLN